MVPTYKVLCLCGANRHDVEARIPDGTTGVSLSLCHCDGCRYSSGVLCTSYHPILKPDFSLDDTLQAHRSAAGLMRYFCRTCGCHMFRSKEREGTQEWEVATGTVTSMVGEARRHDAKFTNHTGVEETKDGGASVWVSQYDGQPVAPLEHAGHASQGLVAASQVTDPDVLGASCACGTVRFHVTRPNDDSRLPHSYYPDLMYAYKTTPASLSSNPNHDKWWIKGDRYLAGTCACLSCRLFSGFEIQTWAFIPRVNIFFRITAQDGSQNIVPLDFKTLPSGILKSYSSSPNVVREFCGGCGATVFWHDGIRPDLIDVSVGLLRAPEGARAESWLSWWTDRVSFEEEAETKREGAPARTARKLITALESGLGEWGKRGRSMGFLDESASPSSPGSWELHQRFLFPGPWDSMF